MEEIQKYAFEDCSCLVEVQFGTDFDSSKLKEKNHYGLAVIRERVGLLEGTFQIVSDNGTKVIVDVPL